MKMISKIPCWIYIRNMYPKEAINYMATNYHINTLPHQHIVLILQRTRISSIGTHFSGFEHTTHDLSAAGFG